MDENMLQQSNVNVYTLEGNFVKKIDIKSVQTYFQLPNAGIYLLKYTTKDGYNNSFKLIVK